jgi:hypothetical protein
MNPFAPRLEENAEQSGLMGDQTTVEGVFTNFRYAYIFKDTLVYGRLLHNNFTFIYKNYEDLIVPDRSWGREEDVLTTHRLFSAAQHLDLAWDETFNPVGDSLSLEVSRGFSLSIIFNPLDEVHINGRAVFQLKRDNIASDWKIIIWRDESNF